MPSVSVIVRARNEARHLGNLLTQLRAQNFDDPMEIVVVDSGSTDGTLAIAERAADRVVHIAPEEFTFGRSLNRGCAAASGEIFAIVSAHTHPASNNWLTDLVAPFADPGVAMVYGRQLPAAGTRIGEARDFERTYGPHSKVLVDEPFGNNANSAVRAGLWRRHGFDESLSGLEDIEWARHFQREGYTVRYAANAAIVHIHEESAKQVFRRFHREGAAHAELFPTGWHYWGAALVGGVADTLRDLRFGRNSGAPASELALAPVFRGAATVGFYRGGVARERQRLRAARRAIASPAEPRRVVIAGPERHELADGAPPAPAPGELLVRVAYVGVCATDVEIADGRMPYYVSGRASFPIVPGHEYSGVVEAAGSPEHSSLVGKRVVAECVVGCGHCAACRAGNTPRCERRQETGVLARDGAYASHVVVPARGIHVLPDGLPLHTAALVEPAAVVHKAIRRAGDPRWTKTAVVGAGPIGHLAAQMLRAFGAEVLVIDIEERRLRPLHGMAFSTAAEVDAAVLAGVQVVFEATGAQGVLERVAECAPAGARIVALGVPGHAEHGLGAAELVGRDQEVIGSLASDPADWAPAIEMLHDGRVPVGALLEDTRPLEEYAAAWQALRERSSLKTILSVEPALAGE